MVKEKLINKQPFKGKSAIICGGSKGIGKAIADSLSSIGYVYGHPLSADCDLVTATWTTHRGLAVRGPGNRHGVRGGRRTSASSTPATGKNDREHTDRQCQTCLTLYRPSELHAVRPLYRTV